MALIKVYVQLGMAAEFVTEFSVWRESEKRVCQALANRMNAEVRALQGNTELGRFIPQRNSDKQKGIHYAKRTDP